MPVVSLPERSVIAQTIQRNGLWDHAESIQQAGNSIYLLTS
jgi:hypothetical protein